MTAAVPGQRGDVLLEAGGGVPAARALGRQSARVVAVLRQQGSDSAGPLVDRGLAVGEWPAAFASLAGLARQLRPGLAAAGLDVADHSPLLDALTAADARMAAGVLQRSSLVHGDLNAKNLIVDPDTGRLRAVLDWEFAHAGTWLSDVGNLLRGAGGSDGVSPAMQAFREGLVDAMHKSLLDRIGPSSTPTDWVRSAHDHDLFAVVELAARPVGGREPPPVALARAVLRQLPRSAWR